MVACLAGCCLLGVFAGNPPLFTTDIVVNGNGELLMTQKGTKCLDIYSSGDRKLLYSYPLDEVPTGLLLDGENVYVTTFGNTGHLQFLSLKSGQVEYSIPTGSGACHPMFGPDKKHIYVCNQFSNTVVEVDPAMRKVVRRVEVLREPKSAVFSKDGKYMFVANYLPSQRADLDVVAACVSVIEMDGFTKVKDIQLANGSNALRGMCITPDGKYIYVSHNLGRFTVPTSQLQQGWMNTSAFSIIDVAKQTFAGAILVDEPERGAAGIWNIACDEEHIFISHSGTHEISVIDHPAMLEKFESVKNLPMRDVLLRNASGKAFYNTSKFTFERLLDDPDNIEANFRDYLNGFSENVQDILEKFKFDGQITTMSNKGILYIVIKEFTTPKANLHPDVISNLEMGYIFEEIIRRFSESHNEDAGQHYTPREVIQLMVNILFYE